MQQLLDNLRFVLLITLLGTPAAGLSAADPSRSEFGAIAIPQPAKPSYATSCVAPVEVMRRDHMKLLLHQRDASVIGGERDGKYSLVGCINCHNPTAADGSFVRYQNPQHFCADCHRYTGVKIDCFECHADRGLPRSQQSRLEFNPGSYKLTLPGVQQLGKSHVD